MAETKIEKMNRGEKSLLLFLETQAVDFSGRVNVLSMSADDFNIASDWNDAGFIEFGRIASESILKTSRSESRTRWVKFSDEAYEVAHKLRKERAERTFTSRNWKTTDEARAETMNAVESDALDVRDSGAKKL